MKADIRLRHTCQWHFVPGSEESYKPFSGDTYRKHKFGIECPRCHINRTVYCTSAADMTHKISKYPVMPVFPK